MHTSIETHRKIYLRESRLIFNDNALQRKLELRDHTSLLLLNSSFATVYHVEHQVKRADSLNLKINKL